MTDNVVRLVDYERKSRNPDAAQPRNPADADVIKLPRFRKLNLGRRLPSVFLPNNEFATDAKP